MPDSAPHSTGASYDALSPARRRRLLLRSLLRSVTTAALLLAVYYLVPLDRPVNAVTALELTAGLMVFAAAVAWQVRVIVRSDHPRLQAIEALAGVVPLFLLLFSATYVLVADNTAGSFTEPLSRTDALYFTVTVFTTVGFGDIVPTTGTARILTTVQMAADLIVVGVIAKVLLGAVEAGLRRREPAPGPNGPAGDSRPGN